MHQNRIVPLTLAGGRVIEGFRDALFDAAAREGVSVNEFAIRAAARELVGRGVRLDGVFRRGDLEGARDVR